MHRKFQKIFWRFSMDEPVREYVLKTLTYGTSPATFLAIKCLRQIAIENYDDHPEVCEMLEEDFFMDDCISGASSVEAAKERVNVLSALLEKYGLPLKKWAASEPAVLANLPTNDCVNSLLQFSEGKEAEIKTLGVGWNFESDEIKFSVSLPLPEAMTKRAILSFAAKIFDPLGILGPVTVRSKMLVQELWKDKLGWDEQMPQMFIDTFLKLRSDINKLKDVRLPRW